MGIEGLEHLFPDGESDLSHAKLYTNGKVPITHEGEVIGHGTINKDGLFEGELNLDGATLLPPTNMSFALEGDLWPECSERAVTPDPEEETAVAATFLPEKVVGNSGEPSSAVNETNGESL